jgi:chromosome segregation ATPase
MAAELLDQRSAIAGRLRALEEALARQQLQQLKAEQHNAAMEADLQSIRASFEEQQASLAELDSKIAELWHQVAELKGELPGQREGLAEQQEKLANSREKLAGQREQLDKQDARLKQLKATTQDLNATVQDLEATVEQLTAFQTEQGDRMAKFMQRYRIHDYVLRDRFRVQLWGRELSAEDKESFNDRLPQLIEGYLETAGFSDQKADLARRALGLLAFEGIKEKRLSELSDHRANIEAQAYSISYRKELREEYQFLFEEYHGQPYTLYIYEPGGL